MSMMFPLAAAVDEMHTFAEMAVLWRVVGDLSVGHVGEVW